MAYKVHFKATKDGKAACAVKMPDANGKVRMNQRSNYSTIPAEHMVNPDEFRATLPENRCAHCSDLFTARMNARRAITGKPLYLNAFTKELMK